MLMIGNKAKVEHIQTFEGQEFTKVKLTARGVGKSGKEYTDYKGFATLFNEAHKKSVDLNVGDYIIPQDMVITTGSKDGKYYTHVNILDMDIEEGEVLDDDDSLPFS